MYWALLIERLERVLKAGDLGTLSIEGEGALAFVTLEPSETLRAVYQPLVVAADRKRERARKTEFEADVRKLLGAGPKAMSKRKTRKSDR